MPSPAERSRYRLVVYGFLGLLVLLAAIPGSLFLGPSWRLVALRLAGALIVILGCRRVLTSVRRSVDGNEPSALDAPPPAPRGRVLDERFLRLRDDLVFSHRSRRYFDTFLWPKLRRVGGADLVPPVPRRRGGPSWTALERLIADIERRP